MSAIKRSLDVAGSLAGLVLLTPVLLSVALAVKVSDPAGPVLYRHARLGRHGRPIKVLKFRSMRWEHCTQPHETAEQVLAAMGHGDLIAEFSTAQKLEHDPRVTRLGRVLRKLSLDELPQLLNSLRGDLSLVGPRPITREELARYGLHRDRLLSVKPGITGLWQVSGRSGTGYDTRVRMDVEYVESRSVAMDLGILVRTLFVVASRRGAH